jgi:hypothetical protein
MSASHSPSNSLAVLGTRDQDKITAKVKGKTLEDAREDMETLREYIHDLAEDTRQIQPANPHE